MSEIVKSSLDPQEIARFTQVCSQWWDEDGSFKPLHQLNPTRMTYIRDQIASHYALPTQSHTPNSPLFQGLSVLDVGCGGGLVCEPLRRLGAIVTGIDGSPETIEIAKAHANLMSLDIDYQSTAIEELANTPQQFDVVLALEIVEHVADVPSFIEACTNVLKPGGLMILSTLNRTIKSYVIGILGAEYVVRWVPVGTHQWSKFLTPAELAQFLRDNALSIQSISGMSFNPISWQWSLGQDLDVNYLITATKGTPIQISL